MRQDHERGASHAANPDVVVDFEHDAAAPRTARRAIDGLLGEPDDPIANDAVLSTSELVTNVVQHTDGGGEVRAWDPKPGVPMRVEVEDTDRSIPEPQQSARDHDGGGRGLMLVDRLSDAWGRFRTVLGKVTWAEFDRNKRK